MARLLVFVALFLVVDSHRLSSNGKSAEVNPANVNEASSTASAPQVQCTAYPCLLFEDNFDYLNFSKWKHEITAGGGGNWEFQYYSNNRSNSYTKNGYLYIKPTLTADKYGEAFLSSGNLDIWGAHPGNLCTGNAFYGCQRQGTATNYINVIQSARMRTAETFAFKYGRIEVRAQTPRGDWIWPAIWLLPRHEAYGNWPASGEIDLMESRGNADLTYQGQARGNTYAGTTLHWGPFWPYNKYDMTSEWREDNFANDFHVYSMDWTPSGIVVSFDQIEIMRVEPTTEGGFWSYGGLNNELPPESNPWQYGTHMAPFDEEFYIIMNVAVGGTNGYFSDEWINGGYPKPWLNTSPTSLREFWAAKDNWYPTWNPTQNNGEDAAMKVDYVRVWQLAP